MELHGGHSAVLGVCMCELGNGYTHIPQYKYFCDISTWNS